MAEVTISFAIHAETPQDGAAAFNAIINHPGDLQVQFRVINHKLDRIRETLARRNADSDLAREARKGLAEINETSEALDEYTPDAKA